jgi:hypothetical protein
VQQIEKKMQQPDATAPQQEDLRAIALKVLERNTVARQARNSAPDEVSQRGATKNGPMQHFSDKVAPCGSPHCAGCYDVGDGRKIHPPKSSPEWLAWLERWQPNGKVQ